MTRSIPERRTSGLLLRTAAPVAALALIGGLASGSRDLVLVNESPSLPRGLYVRLPGARPETGSIVALPQPEAVRPYLSRLGMPAETRLIKRVAAAADDPVCAHPGGVGLRDRSVPRLATDRLGRPLPQWRGCRRLGARELFLLGDTPTSFDSRYFGPADRAAIDGVYRSLMTW